jgi:hypothetical protein
VTCGRFKLPETKSPTTQNLPVAWITGPATDPSQSLSYVIFGRAGHLIDVFSSRKRCQNTCQLNWSNFVKTTIFMPPILLLMETNHIASGTFFVKITTIKK